jgi:hypothetical protein
VSVEVSGRAPHAITTEPVPIDTEVVVGTNTGASHFYTTIILGGEGVLGGTAGETDLVVVSTTVVDIATKGRVAVVRSVSKEEHVGGGGAVEGLRGDHVGTEEVHVRVRAVGGDYLRELAPLTIDTKPDPFTAAQYLARGTVSTLHNDVAVPVGNEAVVGDAAVRAFGVELIVTLHKN